MSTFSARKHLHSQLILTLPYPTTKFTGQTIIVTGSNTGMGLEAARHFVRLDAARVILAVRSLQKGNTAADSIHKSTQRSGVVEVWELDLDSYASVEKFAARVDKELDVLHVVVENAGILSYNFAMSEEDERHITVNIVSTMMLAVLLLPKLRETASKTGRKTVLTFTGSWMHFLPKFSERKADNVFKELAKEESAQMNDRLTSYLRKIRELFKTDFLYPDTPSPSFFSYSWFVNWQIWLQNLKRAIKSSYLHRIPGASRLTSSAMEAWVAGYFPRLCRH